MSGKIVHETALFYAYLHNMASELRINGFIIIARGVFRAASLFYSSFSNVWALIWYSAWEQTIAIKLYYRFPHNYYYTVCLLSCLFLQLSGHENQYAIELECPYFNTVSRELVRNEHFCWTPALLPHSFFCVYCAVVRWISIVVTKWPPHHLLTLKKLWCLRGARKKDLKTLTYIPALFPISHSVTCKLCPISLLLHTLFWHIFFVALFLCWNS